MLCLESGPIRRWDRNGVSLPFPQYVPIHCWVENGWIVLARQHQLPRPLRRRSLHRLLLQLARPHRRLEHWRRLAAAADHWFRLEVLALVPPARGLAALE